MSDEEDDYLKTMTNPIIIESDMNEEERQEALEMCATACEKFAKNPQACAQQIKDQLDKKFGQFFHVIVGNGFGFACDAEISHRIHMAVGMLSVLAFKG